MSEKPKAAEKATEAKSPETEKKLEKMKNSMEKTRIKEGRSLNIDPVEKLRKTKSLTSKDLAAVQKQLRKEKEPLVQVSKKIAGN